jgi:hypothetical protein
MEDGSTRVQLAFSARNAPEREFHSAIGARKDIGGGCRLPRTCWQQDAAAA